MAIEPATSSNLSSFLDPENPRTRPALRSTTSDVVHDDYDPVAARRLLAEQGFADCDGAGVIEDAQATRSPSA